jgi:CBS domain-containing protein
LELRLRCSSRVFRVFWAEVELMRGTRHHPPIMPNSLRASLCHWAGDERASARLRCAALLGCIGIAALLVTAFIGLERSSPLNAHRDRVTPLDGRGSGYYVVDPRVEPIMPVNPVVSQRPQALAWLALALLLGGTLMAIRYYADRRRRSEEERLQRYQRPRAARPPARIVAKRQAIMAALAEAAHGPHPLRLTVRQLMSEAVVIAAPSASLQTLLNLLLSGPQRHLMICEYGGRLLGVVTDRDLRQRRGKRATDVMTREPVCVPAGALLAPAAALMVDHRISCLPVVEQGRIKGVLTTDDLALALECVLQFREAAAARPMVPAADEMTLLSTVQTLVAAARTDISDQTVVASQSELVM